MISRFQDLQPAVDLNPWRGWAPVRLCRSESVTRESIWSIAVRVPLPVVVNGPWSPAARAG